jgi:hypothetical protein
MADEPRKSKRRRWQWPIVAVVFVSIASWWYWPRGDARLVGKWSRLDEFQRPGPWLILNRNGHGRSSGGWIPWRTSGDKLVLGVDLPVWLQIKLGVWGREWHLPFEIATPARHYQFKVLTADRIRLFYDGADGFGATYLQRLPE